ncbi:unnamed protein product [Calypogeia fissa]
MFNSFVQESSWYWNSEEPWRLWDNVKGITMAGDWIKHKKGCFNLQPGALQLMDWLLLHFSVGIWTSTKPSNMVGLLHKAFGKARFLKFSFVWHRDHVLDTGIPLTWRKDETLCLKPTAYLFAQWPSYGRRYTIIIDDSPTKFLHSIPGNVLHVPSFSDGFGFVDGYVDTVLLAWLQPMLWILRESIVDGHLVDVPEFLEVAPRPNEEYVRAELEGNRRVVEPSKAMLQTWLGQKAPGSEGLSGDIIFTTEQDVGHEPPLVSEVAWEIWKGCGLFQELKKGDSCSIFMDPRPGTTSPRILGRGVVVEENPLAVVGAGLGTRQTLLSGFAYI